MNPRARLWLLASDMIDAVRDRFHAAYVWMSLMSIECAVRAGRALKYDDEGPPNDDPPF